jgi:large subunit ribosomal protein L1
MIIRLKPSSSKGIYLKGLAVSTTMGPGIKIDVSSIKDLAK